MKVLLIDVNCKYSSTGKIVYDLYKYINSKPDCEAAICYGRGNKIKEKNIFKFGIDIETKIHAFLTRIIGLMGYFSFFSTLRLKRFIKKFNPDVVHIHELHSYFVNVTSLLKFLKKRNSKVLCTLHCEFNYTGKCGHSNKCNKWKVKCFHCENLKQYPKTYFFDFTSFMFEDKKKAFLNFNDLTIFTPSKWLSDRCKESFLGDYPIKVINNGIDCSNCFAKNNTIKKEYNIKDEKIVLSVAPNLMSDNKGGKIVLEIAKNLINENIKFILVGVDNKNISIPQNVILVEKIKDFKKLLEFYSVADCFVICSENENFPTTCLEAQCCGTMVCGFDVGGVKETSVLNLDENFVKYGDVNALVHVILRILNENYSKEYISKLAREKFDKNCYLESYFKEYVK